MTQEPIQVPYRAIEIKNTSVTYGDKPALKDINLTINGGSKTAIIGPTAAGKTQLLVFAHRV